MSVSTTRREPSTTLLCILLFWYCLARVLQIFAGRIPSLLIVVFHVIPPALFAVIHGARIYYQRGIFVFLTLCVGIGSVFESISLRTGFPFGHYRFTELMGPKLFGLPLLLALAYAGMGYLSWVLALIILEYQSDRLLAKKVILLPLTASFVMISWDLSMDPVWADIDHAWVWRDGGSYFGVPISNFCGWFLTTYIFYQLFALYLRSRPFIVQSETKFWRLPILFYAASAVGNLLIVSPVSPGTVFMDATGKRWPILEILWTSRLVSIFLMMPLCLIAWVRADRPFKLFTNEISEGSLID